MTDESYAFVADVRDRKRTASGSRSKKNGSKSKKCSLPSDNLSPAKLRKLNGPVESVQLDVPMDYQRLKTLSPSLQFLYIDHLVKEHHARRIDLMQMLCVSPSTITKILNSLPDSVVFKGKPKEPAPEWMEFIGKKEMQKSPALSAGSIKVTGTAQAAFDFLLRLIDDPSCQYNFEISFTK